MPRRDRALEAIEDPADVVTKLLASRNPAVLVRTDGVIRGILTRFDMLQFIAGGE